MYDCSLLDYISYISKLRTICIDLYKELNIERAFIYIKLLQLGRNIANI